MTPIRQTRESTIKVGDRVTCRAAPESVYMGSTGTFSPGDAGFVAAIAPKVRIVSGLGKDLNPHFLVVDFDGGRLGLNLCNAVKVE